MNPYVPRPVDRPAAVPLDPGTDLAVLDEAKIFAAPDDPAHWARWRAQLHRWRAEAGLRLDYDGSRYGAGPIAPFVVDVVWLWDELFYDHDRGEFTVAAYVESAERQFGGVDGVLLWHVPGDRHRRPRPTGVLRLRARTAGRRDAAAATRDSSVRRDLSVGAGGARGDRTDGVVDRCRRGIPGQRQGGGRRNPHGTRRRAAGSDPWRGVAGAVGPHPRPHDVVGAVVRRLRCSRGAAGEVVRAAPPATSHPAVAPVARRRAALRVAQRRRRPGLGERLRRLGGLERPGQVAAARDAARAAGLHVVVARRAVDAARRPSRRRDP